MSEQTMMEEAQDTARSYLCSAIRSIDNQLGEGFAKKNPELIAAMLRTMSQDYETAAFVQGLREVTGALTSSQKPVRSADNPRKYRLDVEPSTSVK